MSIGDLEHAEPFKGYLSKTPIAVTGKFRLWTDLNLTKLPKSRLSRVSTTRILGFSMEGLDTMKAPAKKPAAKKPAAKAPAKKVAAKKKK